MLQLWVELLIIMVINFLDKKFKELKLIMFKFFFYWLLYARRIASLNESNFFLTCVLIYY